MKMQRFNTMRNGYNIEEVNGYIATLESALAEYREKDSAITNTMINAQIAADNIVKNAHLEAKGIRQETVAHLDGVAESLDKQRLMITRFEKDYKELAERYLCNVEETHFKEALDKVNELDICLNSLKNSVE